MNEVANLNNEISQFDYKQLDTDTAEFLQRKEHNMREIVGKAYTELGRELYEAQQELRRQGSEEGVFMEWYLSLGFKKDNVSRWINRYKLFAKCEEPIRQIIEDLPVSLTYEIAKPSADSTPAKAQAKEEVLSGDIDTLKVYKERVKELEERERRTKEQLEQARRSEEIANKKLEEAESKEPEIVEKVVEKEVVKEVVPDHIKKRISFLEEKAGDLEKHKSEIRGYEKKKREIENELANLLSEARKIKDSNNKLAQQATLINAISIPVSHLEKKKAEIEQLMKKDIELTNHGLNTLEIKADFLMEMAVKINRYIEGKKHPNKQNYIEAEVIEHE